MTKDETTKSIHGAITGTVIADFTDCTRVVEVRMHKKHAKYKKTYTTSRKYHVHDPENSSKAGDKITFIPSRPYSRTKKFIIVKHS